MCVCVCVHVCACVWCACMHAHVHVHVCVCVCARHLSTISAQSENSLVPKTWLVTCLNTGSQRRSNTSVNYGVHQSSPHRATILVTRTSQTNRQNWPPIRAMLQKVRMTDGRRMGDGGRVTKKASDRETNKQTNKNRARERNRRWDYWEHVNKNSEGKGVGVGRQRKLDTE